MLPTIHPSNDNVRASSMEQLSGRPTGGRRKGSRHSVEAGFVQKLEDCLTGFVELSVVVVTPASSRSCKWNHFGTHC
jgi:hypothetical protein